MSGQPTYRLPGILQEIAEAAGLEAALEIARVKGGTRAYFAARPGKTHWLSQAVGHDKAQAICRALDSSGEAFVIPMGPTSGQAARWRQMRQMIAAGESDAAVARACGVDYTTVKRHRKGRVATASTILAQLDLFDS